MLPWRGSTLCPFQPHLQVKAIGTCRVKFPRSGLVALLRLVTKQPNVMERSPHALEGGRIFYLLSYKWSFFQPQPRIRVCYPPSRRANAAAPNVNYPNGLSKPPMLWLNMCSDKNNSGSHQNVSATPRLACPSPFYNIRVYWLNHLFSS